MYKQVPTSLNFVDREKAVEKFWEDNNIFKKSMEHRKEGETYTFYDGPPTANGKPHIGHVETRTIKDMIPRYRTMKGYMVPRKAGWDTHGLTQKLKDALIGLNFLTVEFDIAVRPGQAITTKGYDDVEFLISTNPGESLKPLNQVASGGELSRVMLAIKTVLAGKDAIDTLIFDEIDTGISGRTAWKVAEQLSILAGAHQVICITHLPQIAAMADVHFIIEKSSTDDMTITDIHKVAEEESLAELARLLGSDALTEAALSNAKEMKELCQVGEKARK